jgi:hypothetical protein
VSQHKLARVIFNRLGERVCFPSNGLLHPGDPNITGLGRRDRGVVGVLGDRFSYGDSADDSGRGYKESSKESGERRGHHFRIGGRKEYGRERRKWRNLTVASLKLEGGTRREFKF